MIRWTLAAALATGLLVVAGCTGSSPSAAVGTPPTPGSITETVPGVTPPAAGHYGLDDEADVAGIKVRIESVTAVQVESTIPGEQSGPGLVFTLKLRNGSSAEYRTGLLETTLTDAAGGAATRVSGAAQVTAPPAVLAPGAEASTALVYRIAKDKRRPITFTVSVAAGEKAADFTGDAP